MTLIKKAEVEEKRLYVDNTAAHDGETDAVVTKPGKTPAPPILLSRTDTEMVFRPAPFQPITGQKVCDHCTVALLSKFRAQAWGLRLESRGVRKGWFSKLLTFFQ